MHNRGGAGQTFVNAPITIAFVLPDLAGGGAQRVMLTLARGLDPAHFGVQFVVIGRDRTLSAQVPADAKLHELQASRLRDGLPRLIGAIRRLRPRLVVSVMGYVNLALLAARPLLGRKTRLIVREANILDATERALPRWIPGRLSYRILYPRADAIIAPTPRIAEQIGNAAPRAAARIRIIPNPVEADTLRRRATPPMRPAVKGPVIVGAGRLAPQKGFDRLIELMPKLPAEAVLIIYGEGADRAALEGRIAALGLSGRVMLPGFTEQLPAAIAGADVFALPSRWEGLPNVALEALALGTPVVASGEAGVEDIGRAAPPGAVTVAAVESDFVKAISSRHWVQSPIAMPRPSLLPADYEAQSAAQKFSALLADVLRDS